jgi:hypothetical protein
VTLDTNAICAGAEQNASALRLIEVQPFLCLPVIVLGEFRFGLRGSRKRSVLEPQGARLLPKAKPRGPHPSVRMVSWLIQSIRCCALSAAPCG